ncbi:basic blue protein-like [Ananas comosus]|uniref:Basic blue protein-like n=1 Tax=Ananas comosus TaxID=4615 RepID=A0A6P5FT77_ANACO|nr:basic blue protein-like [Ananas comosus]
MTSKQILAAFAIAAVAIFPTVAVAMDYVVGDEGGWNLNGNYTAWAEGKQFRIGDTLVFNYTPGAHNVFKVSGPDFKACRVPTTGAVYSTGNDKIPLTNAGRMWFLCGKGNGKHCLQGMKLVITVDPNVNVAPSPASPSPPPPSSSATRIRVCGYQALPMMMRMILVLVATAVVIVV